MPSDKSHSINLTIEELLAQFLTGSPRKKRALIESIDQRSAEIAQHAKGFLESFDTSGDDWAAGWILQVLNRHNPEILDNLLAPHSSSGWFTTQSSIGIDYSALQQNLLEENFEEADRLTSAFLRQLAGKAAEERGYIYFSEAVVIPDVDLLTIDRLWIAYSQGRFGFSVQGRLLDSLGGRYEKLWPRIGWKKDGVWTRYPKSFNWTLSAPEGHMPLINQLRGVRLIDSLLNHPALKKRR
tara:strand:+ start:3439 stop:4158 length:720 start_codon:yes stop_codon:yes gene_type:complete